MRVITAGFLFGNAEPMLLLYYFILRIYVTSILVQYDLYQCTCTIHICSARARETSRKSTFAYPDYLEGFFLQIHVMVSNRRSNRRH